MKMQNEKNMKITQIALKLLSFVAISLFLSSVSANLVKTQVSQPDLVEVMIEHFEKYKKYEELRELIEFVEQDDSL